MVSSSAGSVLNSSAKLKPASADEVPKKKDGRGRPRKDRTLELAKHSASPATAAMPIALTLVSDKDRVPATADSRLRLPIPSIDTQHTFQITTGLYKSEPLSIHIENSIRLGSSPSALVHRLRCMSASGQILWESLLSAKLTVANGSSILISVATEDCCLHVFSTSTGRRFCPPLVTASGTSQLHCVGPYVMAVTSDAHIVIWNMRSLSCTIRNVSLEPLLSGGHVSLTKCSLTERGLPMITLSNGRCFTYNTDLESWLLLASKDNVIYQCADQQTFVGNTRTVEPLAEMQKAERQQASNQNSRLFNSDASIQQSSTVSHVENQLACCIALQSANEYHFWLLAYIRYLVKEVLELKLRQICDELLGPVHGSIQSSTRWEQTILGFRKRSLLHEVLPIIGSELRLQRLYTEYQQQLLSVEGQSC